LLRKALDSAREALSRLEPAQVPAALRPVVRASEFTAPLEEKLVRELDRLDWLRTKAAEAWKGAEAALSSDGPDRASALFLLRPEGWMADFLRLAWDGGQAAGSVAGERAARDAEALRLERTAAKERLREVTKEADELRREVKRLERAAAEPGRLQQAGAARHRDRLAETEAERLQERAEYEQRVTELEREVKRLAAALQKARAERAAALARADESRPAAGWARGGIGLARALDSVTAAAARVIPEQEAVPGAVAPALPPGVRPDSADAIDKVLDHRGPKHIVVDGYNVGLALAAGKAAEVRARLDPVLARLRTVARPPRSVTVVYDSSREGSRVSGVGGVVVTFSPPGTSADDVIVRLAAVPGTVVISNDREVRERATQAGALALWSEALVAWSRKRR